MTLSKEIQEAIQKNMPNMVAGELQQFIKQAESDKKQCQSRNSISNRAGKISMVCEYIIKSDTSYCKLGESTGGEILRLKAENKRLRSALEFYAAYNTWYSHDVQFGEVTLDVYIRPDGELDKGKIAQQALSERRE